MKATLKELEMKFKNEGKSGYAVIKICDVMANRNFQIGYFEDCAKYHGLSYENTQVELVKYVGWN